MQQLMLLFTVTLTLIAYLLFRYLYFRYKSPIFNIVLLSTASIILTLVVFRIPYEAYIPGRDFITVLLGPATVSLAVPVYRNRRLLKEYTWPIVWAVTAGSLLSMVTAILIARFSGLSSQVIVSIASKSVTVPFAVGISQIYGGDPSLAAAFVVATGTLGSVMGLTILTWCKIHNPVARGLAMGTVSHGQGVATALTEGEQPGSMAGVAMALAGVITSLLAPVILPFFV
jgi:predicted murein hydrolase (TIGR00659 family)